jgi:3',5'-cyclic AMP phosphodiesterase CpdA
VLDLGIRFASFGRALDPKPRIRKLVAALRAACASGAGHLVISGDLTELGAREQFETLAEVIEGERINPELVTLVPGNHDAYTRPDAWAQALDGPLAAFRRSSAGPASQESVVVETASAFLLPLDVACHQHFTRAAGELSPDAAHSLERRVSDLSGRGRPVVIVLHHSPLPHTPWAWQWLHGLRGNARLQSLLARHPDVHVLHGHLHHEVELAYRTGGARIFGAPAVVDDDADAPRVRVYEIEGSSLSSVPTRPKRRAIAA